MSRRSGGLRGVLTARAAEGKEDDGGFMKFLKVEQDIELTPDEYAVALQQEIEAQRKKYYINGEVKPSNLIVPWKPVEESALEKDARRTLKKNGIVDPAGPTDEEEEDTPIEVTLVGEQDVKIEWAGGTPGTKVGYIVEKKLKSATNFMEVATYEDLDTSFLLAKTYAGHEYTYTEEIVQPGDWVYRVLCRDRSGDIAVVDQKNVRVPSPQGVDDFQALIIFLVGSFVILVATFLGDSGPSA